MFTPKRTVAHGTPDAGTNYGAISRYKETAPASLYKATVDSLEAMGSLFENPFQNSGIVVTETEVMIQGRETMSLARLLHFIELGHVELVIFNDTPVVGG